MSTQVYYYYRAYLFLKAWTDRIKSNQMPTMTSKEYKKDKKAWDELVTKEDRIIHIMDNKTDEYLMPSYVYDALDSACTMTAAINSSPLQLPVPVSLQDTLVMLVKQETDAYTKPMFPFNWSRYTHKRKRRIV